MLEEGIGTGPAHWPVGIPEVGFVVMGQWSLGARYSPRVALGHLGGQGCLSHRYLTCSATG